jgi:hypothetical protein
VCILLLLFVSGKLVNLYENDIIYNTYQREYIIFRDVAHWGLA